MLDLKSWKRFWDKVDKGPACWNWNNSTNKAGYGVFGIGGHKLFLAHRVSYSSCVGPIGAGLEIHHKCENPACVNPSHLEPHTAMTHPGTGPDKNRKKTHCKRGHEFTPENTLKYNKFGWRTCRTCFYDWRRYDYKATQILKGGI